MLTLLGNIFSCVLQFCLFARSKTAQKLVNWEIVAHEKFHVPADPQELKGTLLMSCLFSFTGVCSHDLLFVPMACCLFSGM